MSLDRMMPLFGQPLERVPFETYATGVSERTHWGSIVL
jgi:hypothetical protein